MSSSQFTVRRFLYLIGSFILLASLQHATPVWAQGEVEEGEVITSVVGNGSAASCTEAALNTALAAGGTITFSCGAAPVIIPITHEKRITGSTSIHGGNLITLDAGGRVRIFYVNANYLPAGLSFTLSNLTLTNGKSGGTDPNYGGCLYNRNSRVLLSNVTVTNCRAGEGGGLFSYQGRLTLINSTVRNNQATYGGGIISSVPGGKVVLRNTTISANTATGNGGGVFINAATLSVLGSTISDNKALGATALGIGGGIYTNKAGAIIAIEQTQFTNNSAKEGGALFADLGSWMSVTTSQFVGNSGSVRGGALGTYMSHVQVTNSIFRTNQGGEGGAIFNGTENLLEAHQLTVTDNIAQRDGGGLVNASGTLRLYDSTFTGNIAGADRAGDTRGGGIISYNGQATIVGSTFANNSVAGSQSFGGGIGSAGPMSIANSTFTGNQARRGGALYINRGTTAMLNSTLSGNSAESGGGIHWEHDATIQVRNSIIASSPSGQNCATFQGTLTNLENNIQFGDTSCFVGQPSVDPLLVALADNGGPTPTMALGAGSPALDVGDSRRCPLVDQRWALRAGHCDIGAYEASGTLPPAVQHYVYFPVIGQ